MRGIVEKEAFYRPNVLLLDSSGTTVKAAVIHPVSFRTRKLSPPTFSAVLWCASPREAYPRKGPPASDLGTLAAYPCGR